MVGLSERIGEGVISGGGWYEYKTHNSLPSIVYQIFKLKQTWNHTRLCIKLLLFWRRTAQMPCTTPSLPGVLPRERRGVITSTQPKKHNTYFNLFNFSQNIGHHSGSNGYRERDTKGWEEGWRERRMSQFSFDIFSTELGKYKVSATRVLKVLYLSNLCNQIFRFVNESEVYFRLTHQFYCPKYM